jgi:hypothetical protein
VIGVVIILILVTSIIHFGSDYDWHSGLHFSFHNFFLLWLFTASTFIPLSLLIPVCIFLSNPYCPIPPPSPSQSLSLLFAAPSSDGGV